MNNTGFVGNEGLKAAVSAMITGGKTASSIIITGEKGLGKKTAAEYIGAALLCRESKDGKPCFSCADCKMLMHGGHPDFIRISPSGKNGGYKLEDDLRPLVSEAYIKPSQSRYRIAVIADMDNTIRENQNVLLKLVEEPPAHMVIIMTASSREGFLPTILSRVTPFSVEKVEKSLCREAVKEISQNFTEDGFERAFEAVGGNIGKCAEFLDGKILGRAVEITSQLCGFCAEKNEYELLKALWKASDDKNLFKETLGLFSNALRDCAVMRCGGAELPRLTCCKEQTDALSRRLSAQKAMAIFGLCEEYISRINGNANMKLLLNSFCAEIMEII